MTNLSHEQPRESKASRALAGTATTSEVDITDMKKTLAALEADHKDMPPAATSALIDYVVTHFHEGHRQELPELFRLACTVEAIHAAHPAAPKGLANLLSDLQNDLNTHMRKEEETLFPLLRQGNGLPAIYSVAKLRREHDLQNQLLRQIKAITNGFTAPDNACQSWRALYHGLAKFTDDFVEHVHIENAMLFAAIDGNTPDAKEHSSCCGDCR
jgi:regulator of cell morphogenesis and NO signaling